MSPSASSAKPNSIRTSYRASLELAEDVWRALRQEARRSPTSDPGRKLILSQPDLTGACAKAASISAPAERSGEFYKLSAEIVRANPRILHFLCLDMLANLDRHHIDKTLLQLFITPYFRALVGHRLSHSLWNEGRGELAHQLQRNGVTQNAITIHPSARIGYGLSVSGEGTTVVGPGADIGNNVDLQEDVIVHGSDVGGGAPRLSDGVTISARSQVLGPISLGVGVLVLPGSTVLQDVAPFSVMEGNPARVVGQVNLPLVEPSLI